MLFPKGGLYNGAKFPKCSETTLARKGVSGCPKGSIMGKGSGKAMADDVPTYPKVTIVNGGAKRVYFYTVMTNPARVQAPIVGKITKLSGRVLVQAPGPDPEVAADRRRRPDRAARADAVGRQGRLDRDDVLPGGQALALPRRRAVHDGRDDRLRRLGRLPVTQSRYLAPLACGASHP